MDCGHTRMSLFAMQTGGIACRQGLSHVLTFVLTGVAANSMDLVVDNATAPLEAAGEPPAHLRFCCHKGTFVLLLYGRLRLEAAIAGGRVVSEGDPELVTILDQWFTGV
jgi:hypothetical protein